MACLGPAHLRPVFLAAAVLTAMLVGDRGPARAQPAQPASTGIKSIEIHARTLDAFKPDDPSLRRFGLLEFRGGLVLTSSHRGFGGLSAIRVDAKGEGFVAFTDHGDWLTGRIAYQGRQPVALHDVKTAPMLGEDGRPLAAKGWFDTEALAFDGTVAYVGIERVNQIVQFDFARGGIAARGTAIKASPGIRTLPFNKGIEALVHVPAGRPQAGALIALSERGLDGAGNLRGFLIGGPTPGDFALRRTGGYDVSDAVLLAEGPLLVLERKFSVINGVGIRIRRVALETIRPGAVVDGATIFEADMGYEIDNMEGIDAHVSPEGETVLTLVSDDNYSMVQRTLLLQFTLVDP
jgi:hypothetical protein